MSRRFRPCLLLRRFLLRLRRPHKRMQRSRVHLRLSLPRHCNNHKFHCNRDLDWVTGKPMVDGVYRGVKRDTGARSLRPVVVSREPSRYVTCYNHTVIWIRC